MLEQPRLYLGGSFDPIHRGHLQSLEQLRQQLALDQAWLMPAWRSPLKNNASVSQSQRLTLLELAVSDYPALGIEPYEIERATASYTGQTLKTLHQRHPDSPIIFAMGMDSLQNLEYWQDWQHLTDYAHLAVFARPGYSLEVSSPLEQWLKPRIANDISQLHQHINGQVWITQLTPFPYASSDIRQLLTQTPQQAKSALPVRVYQYIKQHNLYHIGDSNR